MERKFHVITNKVHIRISVVYCYINNAISLIRTNFLLSGTGLFGLARMYCIHDNTVWCIDYILSRFYLLSVMDVGYGGVGGALA